MRRLSKVVNIVPVIAKADTLTLEERDYFKQRVGGEEPSWIFLRIAFPSAVSPHSPRYLKPNSWPGAQHIPGAAAQSSLAW